MDPRRDVDLLSPVPMMPMPMPMQQANVYSLVTRLRSELGPVRRVWVHAALLSMSLERINPSYARFAECVFPHPFPLSSSNLSSVQDTRAAHCRERFIEQCSHMPSPSAIVRRDPRWHRLWHSTSPSRKSKDAQCISPAPLFSFFLSTRSHTRRHVLIRVRI